MPPRVKITKDEIIERAIDLVREGGGQAINARAIAKALGCSTQPIFSNFATVKELELAVVSRAYELYTAFLESEAKSGKYPKYKAFGMAYIRFAKEERELFKLLFMCDRGGKGLTPTADFEASVQMIMSANEVTREEAQLIHLEMWSAVHGIATMQATSFVELDWELISTMLTDIYQGVRARYQK